MVLDPGTVAITCDKVASLGPTWALFPGLTVLFDNNNNNDNDNDDDDDDDRANAGPALYDVLADVVGGPDGADSAATAARYGLCLLPASTYHVTVCDGPNRRRRADLPDAARAAFDTVVAGLPAQPEVLPPELALLEPTRLDAMAQAHPVTFGIDQIEVRGHAVVASLRTVDATSRAAYVKVRRAQRRFALRLDQELQLRTQQWRPHTSVGYLANRELAATVRPLLARWNDELSQRAEVTATYASASLYGFTDMVSFTRLSSTEPGGQGGS